MNERDDLSLDRIEKMLWEATGHKLDATVMDAIKTVIQARELMLSSLWGNAPSPLIESHLSALITLAVQLLDTGGRMRLDPSGQLDVPMPWATRDDIASLELKVKSLAAAVHVFTEHMPDQASVPAWVDAFEQRLADRMSSLREPDLDAIMGALRADPSVLIKRTVPDDAFISPGSPHTHWRLMKPDVAAALDSMRDKGMPVAVAEPVKPKPKPGQKPAVKPGCYLNPDGTITCRLCGKPKQTADYYRDKASATGFKSACKSCERDHKQAA